MADVLAIVPVFVLITVVAAYASLSRKLSGVVGRVEHLEETVREICED
jgi:hypothetical protein